MALEQVQRRRQAVSTIHDIVSAMRAIAAGRIQGTQRALAAAQRYEAAVRRGLVALAANSAARSLPAGEGRTPLLIVITSEQPFCGAFNQDILGMAEQRLEEFRRRGKVYLVAVGQRGVRQLASRGVVADASEPAATTLQGLRDLVKRLARVIDDRYAAQEVGALHVIYSRYRSVSEQVPSEERILPLDLGSIAVSSPEPGADYYRYLPTPVLLAGLVSEYAFISLYRVLADSFASEQASRLIAMDAATRNTEKMLDALRDLERRERQGQITRQVLELLGARFALE